MKNVLVSIVLVLLPALGIFAQSPTLQTVISKLENSLNQRPHYQFDFSSRERFPDGYSEGSGTVQLYSDPLLIKMRQTAPLSDTEITYEPSKHNGKLLVKPKGMPKGILLSPNAPKIRKHSHHSILDIGFQTTLDFIKRANEKYDKQAISIRPATTLDGKHCILLSIKLTDVAKTKQITLEESTSLYSLAKQYDISEYKIIELNGLKSNKKVQAGTTLTLPLHYAHTIELYLDKTSYLPITQIIYDELGLLEQYDYRNIKKLKKIDQ